MSTQTLESQIASKIGEEVRQNVGINETTAGQNLELDQITEHLANLEKLLEILRGQVWEEQVSRLLEGKGLTKLARESYIDKLMYQPDAKGGLSMQQKIGSLIQSITRQDALFKSIFEGQNWLTAQGLLKDGDRFAWEQLMLALNQSQDTVIKPAANELNGQINGFFQAYNQAHPEYALLDTIISTIQHSPDVIADKGRLVNMISSHTLIREVKGQIEKVQAELTAKQTELRAKLPVARAAVPEPEVAKPTIELVVQTQVQEAGETQEPIKKQPLVVVEPVSGPEPPPVSTPNVILASAQNEKSAPATRPAIDVARLKKKVLSAKQYLDVWSKSTSFESPDKELKDRLDGLTEALEMVESLEQDDDNDKLISEIKAVKENLEELSRARAAIIQSIIDAQRLSEVKAILEEKESLTNFLYYDLVDYKYAIQKLDQVIKMMQNGETVKAEAFQYRGFDIFRNVLVRDRILALAKI